MTLTASLDFESGALFEALIATAVDGIMVIDADGIVHVCNPACERLFGYPALEVIGQNVKMLMPPPYRDEHDGYLSNYARTGDKRIIGIGREVMGRRKNGTTFPMYLSVGEGAAGDKRFFVGIIHDLTLVRAEETERAASDRRLASIVESSEDAILSKTLDGIVLSWNGAAERIFGYSADEILGRPIAKIIPPGRLSEEQDILRRLRRGEQIEHYETVRCRKDGSEVAVSLTISPLRDKAGRIVGASKIVRDITERKDAEARAAAMRAELFHASRLSEMGRMTAAIAHEVNQPLASVTNFVNAAKRLLADPQDAGAVARARDMVEQAAAQALRAGAIIRNLRDFSSRRESERTLEDINRVVEEAIALGLAGAGNVTVDAQLVPGLPQVLIDKVQIQQVLVNLIRNGVEAMASSHNRRISICTGFDGAETLTITVSDTGPGVPKDVAAHLFEPFATTKKTGMGIGLNICRTILEDHDGDICLVPAAGKGAAFRIWLPSAELAEDEA